MSVPPDGAPSTLRRVLNTAQLWSIAVGMVISGLYFGWNKGWAVAGTTGFLIATLLVTVLYLAFIFCYAELTAAIPNAGGPFAYASRALGPTGGFIAGFATLVDFLMAPPAIAAALGAYAHFLNPSWPVAGVATGSYLFFIGINLIGIKEAANFSMLVTILSVAELLLFMALIVPAYQTENFLAHNESFGFRDVFAALPFAIWFYIAIEGVAMVAEEVRDPHRTIPRGYLLSIATLMLLTLGVMILSGGVGDWRHLSRIDHPLPETLSLALGQHSFWSKLFASLGLFGLIASFHGNTIGYSRQVYALARSGYLPDFLAAVNSRFRTPHWALLTGGVIGLIALWTGTTDDLIILSALGALVMYLISLFSLFILRKKEPELVRPFRTPYYPFMPLLAFGLALICLISIIYYNLLLSLLFVALLAVSLLLFWKIGVHPVKSPLSQQRP